MKNFYDSIYLSPHLDDAVLSCGGQIYQQIQSGKVVLVVTTMAGDPLNRKLSSFAMSLQDRWELAVDAVNARRQEDVKAGHLLGFDILHWKIPDCIYRVDPTSSEALYASEEALFGQIHAVDDDLIDELVRYMTNLPTHQRILIPLAVGHHVDHQLVRLAAERWPGKADFAYYEEYPYARDPALMRAALTPEKGWYPEVIPLSRQAISTKIRAASCYRSQISTFFDDLKDLAAQITLYSQKVGGERLWHTREIKT
ncbi:MAG: PIG-L family deacetylase [Chloroflexota bacterium]